ncbi:hypothetical protein EJ110_NYTH03676 [Nymphaea thermarum]|nr:hypothetical protein EJ110_NYTH03676 [Nymphaea thermarum]
MEGETARNDVRALLEEIRGTEAIEARLPLVDQLERTHISNESDLACVAECLIEPTCLEVPSCKLNRAVMHVACKHLQLGNSLDNLSQFLILATKLIVDSLSFSTATCWALAKSPIFVGKVLMLIVENFVSEQLKLLKASICEIKRLHSVASEVLKCVQEGLDAAVRLCKNYSQDIDWDSLETINEDHESSIGCEREEKIIHVVKILSCTIEDLYELGIVAATGGGSLVTILNLSWKGVVMLLQPPKQILTNKISVNDIIMSLISLATESLRCAAEAWVSITNVSPVVGEVKRAFLPIKFYLINAVRISSTYPCQAFGIYKEISLCVLKFSTIGFNFCKEKHLKTANEAMTEFLEPTYFLLLHTLLNSSEIECNCKFQLLDWLFPEERYSCSFNSDESHGVTTEGKNAIDAIFSLKCEDKPRPTALLLGRIAILLNLLKSSSDLKEEVVLGVSRKLNFVLDAIVSADVYSSIVGLHIPVLSSAGSMSEVVWQPMLLFVFHTLKTFMVVAASSSAWLEIQHFLFCNIIHPHHLCWEIIMELWCFLIRHAAADVTNDLINKLCSLYSITASSETILSPSSAVRKMARALSILCIDAPQSTANQIYETIFGLDGKRCAVSQVTYLPLLLEGYPLDSLSDALQKHFVQRAITALCGLMENSSRLQGKLNLSRVSGSGLFGEPLYTLSAALCHHHVKDSELTKFIPQILKFTITVINAFEDCNESSQKDSYGQLLHQALMVISSMKRAYSSHDMEGVILGLQKLFSMDSTDSGKFLVIIKPALSSFLAGLGHMEIAEVEENAVSSAIWELYHSLLRERHWALAHLALSAFGYFAARTSCNQLWRFVPQDAALSFDKDTGLEATEERFMSELKAYLEKGVALIADSPSKQQLGLLEKEAMSIQGRLKQEAEHLALKSTAMEVDDENHVAEKKRKFPEVIGEGMMLLQRGLEIVRNGLEEWRGQKDGCPELQDDLSTHLSCLEDVIAHLMALEDKG